MMKKLFGVMLLFYAISVSAQKAQKVEFKADINTMTPMSYPTKSGLSSFSFEIRNDSAFVHLPYIGEVYNPTLNYDGLNFKKPCAKIKIKDTKKKDGKIVSFLLRHDIVTYDFNVTLWDNKRVDIFMQPSNAQSCSYMGDVVE